MKFVLLENFKIVNEDADFAVGRIRSANGRVGPFQVFASVTADDCGSVEVGIARTFDECVRALADYYEDNPPRWCRRSARWYEKETLYSHLSVEQDQQGRWRAERDGFPLLQGRG